MPSTWSHVFSLCFSVLLPQNSTLTIEEFHSKLQEATNFPLRPFVVPFLKVGIQICNHYKGAAFLYVPQTRIWKAFRHLRSRWTHLSSDIHSHFIPICYPLFFSRFIPFFFASLGFSFVLDKSSFRCHFPVFSMSQKLNLPLSPNGAHTKTDIQLLKFLSCFKTVFLCFGPLLGLAIRFTLCDQFI